MKRIFSTFILSFFVFIALEVTCRLLGWQPYLPDNALENVTIIPGGRVFETDSVLGWRPKPGKFDVSIREKGSDSELNFQLENLDNYTRSVKVDKSDKENKIWIFGSSVSYGWSVSDKENYPALLQSYFGNCDLSNFSGVAYSPVQSLLRFRRELAGAEKPKIIFLSYTRLHDLRNTLIRKRRKFLRFLKNTVEEIPYAESSPKGELIISKGSAEFYVPFLMRYSSLVHRLESFYNKLEQKSDNGKLASQLIVSEFNKLSKEVGAEFVLLMYGKVGHMKRYVEENNIKAIHLSFTPNSPEQTNLPYDVHPNKSTHKQFAEKIIEEYSYLAKSACSVM